MPLNTVFLCLSCLVVLARNRSVGEEAVDELCLDGHCSVPMLDEASLMQFPPSRRKDAPSDPGVQLQYEAMSLLAQANDTGEHALPEPASDAHDNMANATVPVVLLQFVRHAAKHSAMLLALGTHRAQSAANGTSAEVLAIALILLILLCTLVAIGMLGTMATRSPGHNASTSRYDAPPKVPRLGSIPRSAQGPLSARAPVRFAASSLPSALASMPPASTQPSMASVPYRSARGPPMSQLSTLEPAAHQAPQPSWLSMAPSQMSCMPAVAPLCPELLAPEGNETVLCIPCLSSVPLGLLELTFPVKNADMDTMLGVTLELAKDGWSGAERGERLQLFEWQNRQPLASCHIMAGQAQLAGSDGRVRASVRREGASAPSSNGGIPVFDIGSIQGHVDPKRLRAGPASYLITAEPSGQMLLRIQGHDTGHERGLVATADGRGICAMTNPANESQEGFEYCWLKAGPGVDAGLALLSMLAIDRLLQLPNR